MEKNKMTNHESFMIMTKGIWLELSAVTITDKQYKLKSHLHSMQQVEEDPIGSLY